MGAAKEHDAAWHSRPMLITAIGLSLGMSKSASAHPYFRAANSKDIPIGTGEEQEEEQQVAGAVASGGAPQEDEEAPAEEGAKESERKLQAMRSKAKNTLFLAAELSVMAAGHA